MWCRVLRAIRADIGVAEVINVDDDKVRLSSQERRGEEASEQRKEQARHGQNQKSRLLSKKVEGNSQTPCFSSIGLCDSGAQYGPKARKSRCAADKQRSPVQHKATGRDSTARRRRQHVDAAAARRQRPPSQQFALLQRFHQQPPYARAVGWGASEPPAGMNVADRVRRSSRLESLRLDGHARLATQRVVG